MFQQDFFLGGLSLRVSAPQAVTIDDLSRPFLLPGGSSAPPALHLRCTPVPDIPVGGTLLHEDREHLTTRLTPDSGTICRYTRSHSQAAPFACLRYDIDEPAEAELLLTEESWPWSADTFRLWAEAGLPQLLLGHGRLLMHASFISYRDQGIIFTAPSGTGKSTQANIWKLHRAAQILNGDKAVVQPGTPPMAHGVPVCGTSGIAVQASKKLAAIVVLSKSDHNTARRLTPSQAIAAVLSNCYADQSVPGEWQRAIHLVMALVTNTPVFAYACTKAPSAADDLEQTFIKEGILP